MEEEVQNSSYQNKNLKGIEIIRNKQGVERFRVRIRKRDTKRFLKLIGRRLWPRKIKTASKAKWKMFKWTLNPRGNRCSQT